MKFNKKLFLRENWFLCTLFTMVFTLHIPYFTDTFIGEDETIYLLNAQFLLEGNVLYKDIIHGKGPVYIYFFAFLSTIFGESIIALRVASAIVNSLNSVLLFFVGKKLHSFRVGVFSSSLFGLSIALPSFNGFYGMPDSYMNLFCLLGILLSLEGIQKENPRLFFLAGIAISIAILSKQVALFIIPTIIFITLVYGELEKKTTTKIVNNIAFIILGLFFVFIPVSLFFYSKGALNEMFEQIVINWLFRISGDYEASMIGNWMGLFSVFSNVPIILYLGFAYLLYIIHKFYIDFKDYGNVFNSVKENSNKEKNKRSEFFETIIQIIFSNQSKLVLFFWSISIFIFTLISIRFRSQYALFLLPPISLCTGFALAMLFDIINNYSNKNKSAMSLIYSIIILLLIIPIPNGYAAAFLGNETIYSESTDIKNIGNYINTNSNSDDYIYVLSGPKSLYLFSERDPSSVYFKNLYDYRYESDISKIDQILSSDLQAISPKYIITLESDSYKIINGTGDVFFEFKTVINYLTNNYTIKTSFYTENGNLDVWIINNEI